MNMPWEKAPVISVEAINSGRRIGAIGEGQDQEPTGLQGFFRGAQKGVGVEEVFGGMIGGDDVNRFQTKAVPANNCVSTPAKLPLKTKA